MTTSLPALYVLSSSGGPCGKPLQAALLWSTIVHGATMLHIAPRTHIQISSCYEASLQFVEMEDKIKYDINSGKEIVHSK